MSNIPGDSNAVPDERALDLVGEVGEPAVSKLGSLFSRDSGGGDDRKTVTFGDSSAVRSDPKWSLISLIVLILAWWASTKAWGFPSDFQVSSEANYRQIANCDCDDDFFQIIGPRSFPSPRDTLRALEELMTDGFQNISLWEHTWASLWRVIQGMFFGVLFGVPIGFAMGLSSKARGFFDTPVELFRPIPPLALIPLFILAFGIGDPPARNLLIFASIWIMIIAARSGVRTANLSKVRAAYSLGASKRQVLLRVLLPNALPELFTGVRVALGVSWGTLVAAELVGARDGLGQMIFAARPFFRLDVIVAGIIVIAVLGVLMDVFLRFLEARLIPWRGKG
ncbi:MAG: ABC transporter permease [Acidimicrobiales bacterium]